MKVLTPILSIFVLLMSFSCATLDRDCSSGECPATAAAQCPASAQSCCDADGKCKTDCKSADAASSGIMLCGGCGQVKGSPDCCLDGAEKCSGCSLDKGAPGCCKMEKGKDAKVCGCGEIAGSDACKTKCAK
ncbi:MAG: hypothetical protein P1V35_16620 [Planctomycetota bacterium]|nr:hypothetical protein [Planctomycetota bacterium]